MAVRDVVQAAAGVGGGGEYVEDVFSTYLYTGNGSTQTITNGIDLDGEGGLVWVKDRTNANGHILVDTVRGGGKYLQTNSSGGQTTNASVIPTFYSDGFETGGAIDGIRNYASWTFRKAPKFFDVVTYTGDGVAGRTVAHNLGSVPGCMIVKKTNGAADWNVYHRGINVNGDNAPETDLIYLNLTVAAFDYSIAWNDTAPTSTEFTLGSQGDVNASGTTYVAYLFAHNAGGFGDDGEQNVISCGSFTTDGSEAYSVNLGYEPQFVLIKRSSNTGNWSISDDMRGMPLGTNTYNLFPNLTNAEVQGSQPRVYPNATGFTGFGDGTSQTHIYIAIRRPMKTPESGTEVFAVDQFTVGQIAPSFISDFPVDMAWLRNTPSANTFLATRLLGAGVFKTNGTDAWGASGTFDFDYSDGWNSSTRDSAYYSWMFRRTPSFMDVVAYTGTGVAKTEAHNLGVVPELMIVKDRDNGGVWGWSVYHKDIGNNYILQLEASNAKNGPSSSYWNSVTPSDSVFNLGDVRTNWSGTSYINYIFASCPGVSKVSSYTGTGADINVDCGFSAGARFVLIKRTDSTGDWYYWDSVRGISAGNDPYMLLNSTAAEVTSTDYIDPLASGFTVTSSAPAALNASGGSYIFLAIA